MPIADDLVAYWTLSETTGTTRVDSTGNGNDLLDVGGTDVPRATGVCADFGAGFSAGVHNELELTGGSTPDLTPTGPFQISGWAYGDGSGYLVSKRRNWPNFADYSVFSDGTNLIFEVRNAADSASGTVTSSIPLVANQWMFWTVAYDGANISISVSSSASPSLTTDTMAWIGGVRSGSNANFRLGRQDDTSQNPYSGRLDEMGFWGGRVLTASEVDYLAGILPAGGCPPDYPFSDAPGNISFNMEIEFSANLWGNTPLVITEAFIDSAKPTTVFWYHENRLYVSFAGKTYCRDMLLGESGGWTDCGYGYVNSAFVISRFNLPNIAFLAANMRPITYADRTEVVSFTHRNMTTQHQNTEVVPHKLVNFRPFGAPGKEREMRKAAVRFRVWGTVEMQGQDLLIGKVIGRADSGYEEESGIYYGIYEDNEVVVQEFSPGMIAWLLEADIEFFDNVLDIEILESQLEYRPEDY